MWSLRSARSRAFGSMVLAGALVASGLVSGVSTASASPTWSVTPIVGGLNNPRGVAVDGKGSLYVAEAGAYPVVFDPNALQEGMTMGAVSKWNDPGSASQTKVWSSSFTGLYTNVRGLPEVIGASGLSALGNGCMKNGNGAREGCHLEVIVGESKSGFTHETGAPAPADLGTLFELNPGTGVATAAGNVGDQQYQWTADHQDLWATEFPDSNPYGVLVARGRGIGPARTFVADAGANTISEVDNRGTTHVIAYVPNDGVRDATPTCIAQGPDGALYVGTLNLFKNGFGQNPGHSDVWRIDPNTTEDYLHAAHLWATGLTTVTSCAFDQKGNFWATEMFANDVVRIPFSHPTSLSRFGDSTTTPLPGGIAPAADGSVYVAVNSVTFAPNTGAVVKLTAG